jgi:ubiquinone biosynthesis protein UbiJ
MKKGNAAIDVLSEEKMSAEKIKALRERVTQLEHRMMQLEQQVIQLGGDPHDE